jgi:hypothetical protein
MREREEEGQHGPSAPMSHRLDEPRRDIPWPVALQQSRPPFLPACLSISHLCLAVHMDLFMVFLLDLAGDVCVLNHKASATLEYVGRLVWSHPEF